MDALLYVGLCNAVLATLLAVVAVVVTRLWRRPAVAHALWLLVLLKLVTPPLAPIRLTWPFEQEVDPVVQARDRLETVASPLPVGRGSEKDNDLADPAGWVESSRRTVSQPRVRVELVPSNNSPPLIENEIISPPRQQGDDPVSLEDSTHPAESFAWQPCALALWLTGSLGWWAIAALRIARFQRLLRHAQPASPQLHGQAQRVALRLGLVRCPEILLLPAPISPLLWSLTTAPRLLLPAALMERLGEVQRDTLLVHELAHLRRRDHWVRWLECVVLGLYWWHPVAWWARRRLQEAEEQCCDAWVVWALPNAAHAYAEALVQTITFLSRPPLALPALASGIGHVPLLKRRLTMILNANTPRRLTWSGLLAVLALALVLPLLPMRAAPLQAGPDEPNPVKEPPQRNSGDKIAPGPNPTSNSNQPNDTPQPVTNVTNPVANDRALPPGQKKDRPKPGSVDRNALQNDMTPGPAEDKARPTESRAELIEQVQLAEEQIELLQAKLAIKEAQLRVARTGITSAKEKVATAQRLRSSGTLPESEFLKAHDGLTAAEADLIVKEAELKEPQIRLRQAERRLAKLKERLKPVSPKPPVDRAPDKSATSPDRLRDLDKKLDALMKEVEALRREMRKARPQPEARKRGEDGVLYVNRRDFEIPVAIDAAVQKKLSGILLIVSTDEGRNWQQAARAAPTAKHFTYHASKDGEHWFYVATVDNEGRAEPFKDRPPSQIVKIRVLTKPPAISLTIERRAADSVVHWDVSGQHVDLQSLRLEQRATKNGDGSWSNVGIEPEAQGKIFIRPDEGGPIEVRMRAKDRASNVGETTVEVPGK